MRNQIRAGLHKEPGFLVLFLLCTSLAWGDVVIDGIQYDPCQKECTQWIFRTENKGVKYEFATGIPGIDLVYAGFSEGTYKITACGNGADGSSDSLYVALDDTLIATLTFDFFSGVTSRCTSKLQGGGEALVDISKGAHKVSLHAREDGVTVTDFKMERQ